MKFPMRTPLRFVILILAIVSTVHAELKLPAIFGDHMVLQQKQANPIWGWDTPGTQIRVDFAGESYSTTADPDGKWRVLLASAPAASQSQTLTVHGSSERSYSDVLVGEVWICSGQSNMQLSLSRSYTGDLEGARARSSTLRIISVPTVGTQELQNDFKGQWQIADPENVKRFSAIGEI